MVKHAHNVESDSKTGVLIITTTIYYEDSARGSTTGT